MDHLTWLTRWYASQCNGSWEHQNGVKLDTLDNPGWILTINLEETDLENRQFEPQRNGTKSQAYDPTKVTSWWICRVEKKKFIAACGPSDLPEIVSIFRNWVDQANREKSTRDAD
ncbi:immunity 53 family protein [Bradyrhizobium sp. STM 3843]|uniref:immunity 53 family protein n=1 Tax=Bradyrhizobium sp. STM 3843 TaxID=551947 RepID=UPI00056761C7|nr:immunity 53 family protein [Bradyrhizobium sp. STM 3843]